MKKTSITHIHIFSVFTIVLLCCLQIRSFDHIVVLDDEFGYWAHAISAAGYDWKDLISETPYYSWGYGIWLIPLIKILPTPELWYKGAILLNVIFLLVSYCLCYKSGRKLFPQINNKIMGAISLIVIIYPSNIIYAQIAWSETLCYVLFWIITYTVIRLDENFSLRYFILLNVLLIYSYAVHNRNIGIILSIICSLILLLIKNQKGILYYLASPVMLIIGYKGIDMIKMHQINVLWSNSQNSSINNVGLDTTTINHYTSRILNEVSLLSISIWGKFFYLMLSFGLLLPIVVIHSLKSLFTKLRCKSLFSDLSISRFSILLSSAAMFGICSLQTNQWSIRKDILVYGRYMENALGPLLLLVLAEAILYNKELKMTLIFSIIFLTVSIYPAYYYINKADSGFNSICSPFIGVFFRIINDARIVFVLLSILIVVIFTILYLSACSHNTQYKIMAILLCIGLTYSCSGCILGFKSAESRKGYYECTITIRDELTDNYPNQELYYIKNSSVDASSMNPKYIQYSIPNRTIHVILPEEVETYLSKDVILMANPNDTETNTFLSSNGTRLIQSNYLLSVYYTK